MMSRMIAQTNSWFHFTSIFKCSQENMAFRGSRVGLYDNTGVISVKILQIYRRREARVGDMILTVIKKKKRVKEYVKKKINFVFLMAQRKVLFRRRGFYYLHLQKNAGVILGNDVEKILGTRHGGFLTLESRVKASAQLIRTCRLVV